MDTTSRKIKELLQEIKSLIGDDQESTEWFHEVQAKASTFETDKEEIAYLEDILTKLQDSDDEAQELEDSDDEAQELEEVRSNPWPTISLLFVSAIVAIAIVVTFCHFLCPRANAANSSTNTVSSSTISKSVDLPKEDLQVIDYKVDGDTVVYDSQIANTQHKVFANGSDTNTLSANAESAVSEMVQYMSHNATALKEKAMTFGIVDAKADVKDWLEKKDGKVYYNNKGKDVFYQTKAFLSRSQTSSKRMEEGSNYYTTGVNTKGNVVISQSIQDLSGQEYIEVSNPKGSTEKYSYRVLIYCGNTVMKKGDIPGVPTEKIEIPPTKPGKPDKPDKPSESKVEKKDPSKDPANQGKAPVGGGQNDGSENGSETPKASLPEKYVAPKAPSSQSSSSSATTPSKDARVSEPSQWSGSGTVTDSNGSTKVEENGAIATPDGKNYSGLTNPSSVPPVESGANGATAPSSSANFAGNGSMSEPAIDD